ncbi:MAG: hypothetical protein GX549_08420 [Clostridiales bacterium]|nr:hypothetical protein [Clostridiales bacterium]
MARIAKMAGIVILCMFAMAGILPSCPYLRLSQPVRVMGRDGRVCSVVQARCQGALSDAAMDLWLRRAFDTYRAPITYEWDDGRLRVASGLSRDSSAPLPGAAFNVQGMIRYDSWLDATVLTLGNPSLPTEGW